MHVSVVICGKHNVTKSQCECESPPFSMALQCVVCGDRNNDHIGSFLFCWNCVRTKTCFEAGVARRTEGAK